MNTEAIPDPLGDPHEDDDWYDEVRLVGENGPELRLVTVPRWKSSGLSGDEWRVSTVWQTVLSKDGTVQKGWADFDGGYPDLKVGCAAIYPGVFRSHGAWHRRTVAKVEFLRKGRVLYTATNDGKTLPLLETCGHLPWALCVAGDQGMDRDEALERSLCFQPGCADAATVTLRKILDYDRFGNSRPSDGTNVRGQPTYKWRRFCGKHSERGDCGLDDADANYVKVP